MYVLIRGPCWLILKLGPYFCPKVMPPYASQLSNGHKRDLDWYMYLISQSCNINCPLYNFKGPLCGYGLILWLVWFFKVKRLTTGWRTISRVKEGASGRYQLRTSKMCTQLEEHFMATVFGMNTIYAVFSFHHRARSYTQLSWTFSWPWTL